MNKEKNNHINYLKKKIEHNKCLISITEELVANYYKSIKELEESGNEVEKYEIDPLKQAISLQQSNIAIYENEIQQWISEIESGDFKGYY